MSYPTASPAHVDFFREHGWIVVKDAVEPADLATIEARCQEIIEKREHMAFDWAWEEGDATRRAGVQDPAVEPDDVLARAQRRRASARWAVEFGSALLGREVEFWYDQFLAKPPGHSAATRWHQDEGYWGRNLDDTGHHLLDAVPRRRREQRLHALHRRRPPRRRARAPAARRHAERPARTASPTRHACRRVPDRAGQRHVPPQQDAAHDDGQQPATPGGGS